LQSVNSPQDTGLKQLNLRTPAGCLYITLGSHYSQYILASYLWPICFTA